MRNRISNVKLALYDGSPLERINFQLDGEPYVGTLKGRNRDLMLGFGEEQDKAIALRVFLDGDSQKIN